MLFTRSISILLLGAVALAGCSETEAPDALEAEAAPEMAMLTGEAFYRERIALPPGAKLVVLLEDVSRMDVAATVLAEYSASVDSPPPYAFELEYDPSVIEERMRYNVRASIKEGDSLVFTSTQAADPFKLGDEPLQVMMSLVLLGADKAPIATFDAGE